MWWPRINVSLALAIQPEHQESPDIRQLIEDRALVQLERVFAVSWNCTDMLTILQMFTMVYTLICWILQSFTKKLRLGVSALVLVPVVPHKAVAEVSKIGHYRRGELLWCNDGRANPLMDRKVVGVVFFGMVAMVAMVAVVAMVAMVTSPQLLDVSIYLPIYLSVCLSIYRIYLSVYLQAWKRSYSARQSQFLNLTRSKTNQFCETNRLRLPSKTTSVCLSVYLSFHRSVELSS